MEKHYTANKIAMKRLRWTLILITVLSSSSTLSRAYEDLDSKCTNSRAGLPACNFERNSCYKTIDGEDPAWKHVNNGVEGPVSAGKGPQAKGGYVYLDPEVSQGQPKKMASIISSGIKAICALFYYATTGSSEIPINVYIQSTSTQYSLVHAVEAQTYGAWKSSSFSCCLSNINYSKWIAFEAASTLDGTAAIDWVDIRLSDMPCDNEELVCYPNVSSNTSLDPVDAPSCASDSEKIEILSCDFNSGNKTSPEYCGWQAASGWEVRQKWDGTGTYDIIYNTEENAILFQTIPDEVAQVCVEVQFIAGVNDTQLHTSFSVNVVTQNGLDTNWGRAYDYPGSQHSMWKRNSFAGVLPHSKSRKIKIVANAAGLKIDYIHIRVLSENFTAFTHQQNTMTSTQKPTPGPTTQQQEPTPGPTTQQQETTPEPTTQQQNPTPRFATQEPTLKTKVPILFPKIIEKPTSMPTDELTFISIIDELTTTVLTSTNGRQPKLNAATEKPPSESAIKDPDEPPFWLTTEEQPLFQSTNEESKLVLSTTQESLVRNGEKKIDGTDKNVGRNVISDWTMTALIIVLVAVVVLISIMTTIIMILVGIINMQKSKVAPV